MYGDHSTYIQMSTIKEALQILEMAEIDFDGSLKDRVEQITRRREEIEKEWMEIKKLEEEQRIKEELRQKKLEEERLRREEKQRIEEELKQKELEDELSETIKTLGGDETHN